MIEYVLNNISINKDDKIFIIYNKCLDEFGFFSFISAKYPAITLIKLLKDTSGAMI